jgi:hypothetical protein
MLSIFAWIHLSALPSPYLISVSSLWVYCILLFVSLVTAFLQSVALSFQSQTICMCHFETHLCVCVFRTVHITLLVTSVIYVRRGMKGMPHREHGQTVKRRILHSASVTAEVVFELTALMVTSAFARLVPWPYGWCKNVCSRNTGNIIKYKYSSGIKCFFVMCGFLLGCNCQLHPLCLIYSIIILIESYQLLVQHCQYGGYIS